MARRAVSPSRVFVGSLLPSAEGALPDDTSEVGSAEALDKADLLERLPALLTPAELASMLRVSPETVRRRIRNGKQATVEVLGIKRISATSATEQVRARVVSRLPGRYRPKSRKAFERQGSLPLESASSDGSPKRSNLE